MPTIIKYDLGEFQTFRKTFNVDDTFNWFLSRIETIVRDINNGTRYKQL